MKQIKLIGMDYRGVDIARNPNRLDNYNQRRIRRLNGKYAILYTHKNLSPVCRIGDRIWGDPHVRDNYDRYDVRALDII